MKELFKIQNPWRENKDYTFSFLKRNVFAEIKNNLKNDKVIGLLGSRRVGKSSLMYLLIEHLIKSKTNTNNIFYFNLDHIDLHGLFYNITDLLDFIKTSDGEKKYLFIDEIQRLRNPGLILKSIYDLKLNIKIYFSGSCQIEIRSKVKENLVGRLREIEIQRLSFEEYLSFNSPITKKQAFYEYLTYGSYPEICLTPSYAEKKLLLRDIFQSYIQKDIINFLNIDHPEKFNNLLVLLASQIGSILSVDNLSKSLKLKRDEVEKYLNILSETFIIKRIYPFYRNYKKELTKSPKIFFLDLGIRNYLLKNFLDLDLRNDKGNLFENFYLIQLLNQDIYLQKSYKYWRTTNQTEIDFIIENGNLLTAIETKWQKKSVPAFKTIENYYKNIESKIVTTEDFLK